jgi:hypothetical protein
MEGSQGAANNYYEGFFDLARVPMLPGFWQLIILETEPINPLYTGQYAVGPYVATVKPSGSNLSLVEGLFSSYQQAFLDFYVSDSANVCNTGADGTEAAPAAVAPTGWWPGLLCGYGHAAWSSLNVKGNRSLTLEVTAEDEQGFATITKAMPVIGVWNATDARGSLPGVASASEPFNGAATGTTTLTTSITEPKQLRISIADKRGDGRPDFSYKARVLYADSLTPSAVSSAGGTITITGMGFRTGNAVLVNGVAATVSSWSANTIVATVPSLHRLGVGTALVADVTVKDLSTGGTTVMTRALSYAAPVTTLSLLTAPAGNVILGQQATVPFAVQVLQGDGVTPVVGEVVTFTTTAGAVQFAASGAATCTLLTDANGIASTLVTPATLGAITLQATGVDGTATPPSLRSLKSEPQPRCSRWNTSQRARPSCGRRSSTSPTIRLRPQVYLSIGGESPVPSRPRLVRFRLIARESHRRSPQRVLSGPERKPFYPGAPGRTCVRPSPRRAWIRQSCALFRLAAPVKLFLRMARSAQSFFWSRMQRLIL